MGKPKQADRRHGEDFNLAGPNPHQGQPKSVYDPKKEGKESSQPEFTLAGTFPRTVRWSRDPEGDRSGKGGEKDNGVNTKAKGETEEAPQVSAAENQRQSVQQPGQDLQDSGGQQTPEASSGSTAAEDTKDEQKKNEKDGEEEEDKPTWPHQEELADLPTGHADAAVKPYNPWAHVRHYLQRPLAEFLGMTVFIFLGISVNCSTHLSAPSGNTPTQFWSWGFALMIAIYIAGGGSGGFVNPSLTIMLSVFRGFPAKRVPWYILAQILGGFTGALLAFAVYRDGILNQDGDLIPEKTGVLFYTQPIQGISAGTAFVTEMLGTAVFSGTIIALGDASNSPPGAGMHAFVIGLLLVAILMSLAHNTRGAFNPARDLGPRLACLAVGYPTHAFTDWKNWWIWGPWAADTVGALVGAFFYDLCIFKGAESPVNYSLSRWKVELMQENIEWLHRVGAHEKAENVQQDLEDGMEHKRQRGKRTPGNQ